MVNQPPDPTHSTGRRAFLKSLLGLGALEPAARGPQGSFYWADLKTGQIGFPTGTSVSPALPGSIMKLVAAAAIREHNLLPANDKLECVGSVSINRKKFTCQDPHGQLTLEEAIAYSCNCFFAQAAEVVNPEIFLQTARQLKLDQPVAGHGPGVFPVHASDSPQAYVLGLADGLQLHALQIMQLMALIAMKGELPALHSAEAPGGGLVVMEPKLAGRTWLVLQQGMQLACRQGTAKHLDPENKLHLAVKTGTTLRGAVYQSWVAGYFPYESPAHIFCARATNGTSQDQVIPLAGKHLFATEWP